MSKLVLPRQITAAKQSRRKDSSSKKAEKNILATKLVRSPEYQLLKKIAASISSEYRMVPGTNKEEDESFLNHCKLLYAYNKLWATIENMAHIQQRREQNNADDRW